MMNPLIDKDFLAELTQVKQREVFAKIIALDFEENPVEEITGNVTQGSVSIDGTSAIRRTCSISMVAEELNINDYYWGLNSKVEVYVGLRNLINPSYPDIIWFPMGVFVLTTFSTSQSISNYTVSLQGKDKMALLNGDLGGSVTALSVDFGRIKVYDEKGNMHYEYMLLKDIITEAVHEYAKEPYHNIIVNDLDDVGLELLEYRGSTFLYLIYDQVAEEVTNYTFDGDVSQGYYIFENGEYINMPYRISEIPVYDNRIHVDFGEGILDPTIIYAKIKNEYHPYSVIRVSAGEVVGYRITDLTYAGDLIASVGQSITSAVLDKIVSQLGDFEYFYNLEGQFIFQRKKTYTNISWNNLRRNEDLETYADNAMETSSYTFSFEDSNLITSFQNAPVLSNVKNDYAIWGKRKSKDSGVDIPIHLRYAIDKKPVYYKTYTGEIFSTLESPKEELLEEIKEELEQNKLIVQSYVKTPNPAGLSEEWWDILDWANLYTLVMGHPPMGTIGSYAAEGKGYGENIYAGEIFDIAKNGTYSRYELGTKYYVYIFDVDYNVDYVGSQTLGYVGHGTGCNHPYSYFTERAQKGLGTSYIYKPVIPEREFDVYLEDKRNEILLPEIAKDHQYNCDWREVLYQMAKDHSLHGHNDDFEAVLIKNNKDYYPSGATGYEQYYTDILSFWRDLYNPELVPIYQNEFIKIYPNKAQYDKKLKEGTAIYIRDYYGKFVKINDANLKFNDNIQYYEQGGDCGHFKDNDVYHYLWIENEKGEQKCIKISMEDVIEVGIPKSNALYKDNNGNTWIGVSKDKWYFEQGVTDALTNFDFKKIYYSKTGDGNFLEVLTNPQGFPVFDVTQDYYLDKGYVSIAGFKPGLDYYVRNGTAATGYSYEFAFSIIEGMMYYKPSHPDEVVTSFAAGETYTDGTNTFTIEHRVYYQYIGHQVVYKGGSLSNGYYSFYDDSGMQINGEYNMAVVGKRNYCYKELPPITKNMVDVYYRDDTTGEFIKTNILFQMERGKMYYKYDPITGTETPVKNGTYKVNPQSPSLVQKYPGWKAVSEFYKVPDFNPLNGGWSVLLNSPELLNFWFDFLDTEGDLFQYSVEAIGSRPKAENNDDVNAIYYRETPTVIFVDPEDDIALQKRQKPGYTFVRCPKHMDSLFTISSQKKSAINQLNIQLYNHTYCTESITVNAIPVYHLEPNTRIFVRDLKSGINGEYIISRLSMPLAYNGTMSITATKAVENMY